MSEDASSSSNEREHTIKKKRSKEEEIAEKLSQLVEKEPYNLDAWSSLIRIAQSKPIGEARQVYERVVKIYPTSGKFWKIYIDHEMQDDQYEIVEKLFQRCLETTLNIDLWKSYVKYIKLTKSTMQSYREKMAHAYDFTIDKMGMHPQAYTFWSDYVNFLKNVEAVGSYAENQRITAVRKIFQRGVMIPMSNIETLWRDYCSFEMSVNPLIGKKMQEDKSREYSAAKKVAKEFQSITKGINVNMTCLPPCSNGQQIKQKNLWKSYIVWEKSNPLNTDDVNVVAKRVMFAYEQCILCLGMHVDVWIEACRFLIDMCNNLTTKGDQSNCKIFMDQVESLYERAISGWLKNSPLIYYAYAEFAEFRLKYELVHKIYKSLLDIKHLDPTLTYVHYMNYSRRAEGVKAFRNIFKISREDPRSTFQVYEFSAMIEYYGKKDSSVAFKIFELGMKKHNDEENFLSAYMTYMTNINEDNNTRVLYERILTTDNLKAESAFAMWNNFMRFEFLVGDLSSIQKIDKRRCAALSKNCDDTDDFTALMVDRYCYGSLIPCSDAELSNLKHRNSNTLKRRDMRLQLVGNSLAPMVMASGVGGAAPITDHRNDRFVRPDIGQMKPFLPRMNALPGSHIIEGGLFPPPLAIAELLTKLPPPAQFHGPFVLVDKFMDYLEAFDLSTYCYTPMKGDCPLDAGTQNSIEIAMGRKRRAPLCIKNGTENNDSDEEDNPPPTNDLFRSRQQKKAKLS